MRYVIVISAIAAFLIWDGLKNEGRYLDKGMREFIHLTHKVGL